MRIPETIQVGAIKYQIEYVERLLSSKDRSVAILGECDALLGIIRLDPTYPQRLPDTLLHELLEAIKYEYTLDISHETLERLTTTLLDTIQRNSLAFHETD